MWIWTKNLPAAIAKFIDGVDPKFMRKVKFHLLINAVNDPHQPKENISRTPIEVFGRLVTSKV